MLFKQAMLAAQTAFHFGDRAAFVAAIHFAQRASDADADTVRQLKAAIAKFPANEALEIVSAAEMQHRIASSAAAMPRR